MNAHGAEVGVDWVNGLVLHENDADWHPLEADVKAAAFTYAEHADAAIGFHPRDGGISV